MDMPESGDSKILTWLRSEDNSLRNKALKAIYQDNYQTIASFILKNSGREEDAEDLFQDGLLALYEQVMHGYFKGDSSIKTYLFAICRNQWMKRLRKASTKNESLGSELDFAGEDQLPLDTLIADEESNTLADLLEQLGSDCKKVLLLYYYERKKMKEIASIMGYSGEQVAKNKKKRCLKKLKETAGKITGFNPFYF